MEFLNQVLLLIIASPILLTIGIGFLYILWWVLHIVSKVIMLIAPPILRSVLGEDWKIWFRF